MSKRSLYSAKFCKKGPLKSNLLEGKENANSTKQSAKSEDNNGARKKGISASMEDPRFDVAPTTSRHKPASASKFTVYCDENNERSRTFVRKSSCSNKIGNISKERATKSPIHTKAPMKQETIYLAIPNISHNGSSGKKRDILQR